MENIINYFNKMPIAHKFIWILICIAGCWIAESVAPMIRNRPHQRAHILSNLVFLGINSVINVILGIVTVNLFAWIQRNEIGLLYKVNLPTWASLIITLLILDLIAQWLAHYLLHRIKWGWKFHVVHHSDAQLDFSTGTRHHPGDYIVRELFSLTVVVALGAPMAYYVIYRMITIFFTYTSHANFELPDWLDRFLGYLFVTPKMHKFHHHYERPWTDSNFGNVFSIWDRMFGTLVYEDPRDIVYGVDVVDFEKTNEVIYQMKLPFDPNLKTDY